MWRLCVDDVVFISVVVLMVNGCHCAQAVVVSCCSVVIFMLRYTCWEMNLNLRIYMNADANEKLCWLCCCCCILHSWHTRDDGGFNPIVWIEVLLILLCSQVEGWWPSVHPWWWKWYRMHCFYDVAFHFNWHCMYMS